MKALHITPSTNGYEEVTLVANRINRKNHLSLIIKDGEEFMTGGFLLEDNLMVRTWLDKVERSKQYEWVKAMRQEPFAKAYSDE
jgi:hypothetical protein